ncbi:MAG: T9SS type A sorting domain-containing protein [Paludibacteraceae bacterium]|nr:T9SS type A sorting domain-containing protein [Paludibacteraceae bacterium]
MFKRFLFLVFLSCSCLAYSQTAWNGTTKTEPSLSGKTYSITTGAELAWVAQQSATNSFEGYTFLMQNSIDLGEGHNWTPIGGDGTDFEGTFDGGCYTIKNFNIYYLTRSTDVGFFGAVGKKGTVKNLCIESGKIFVSEVRQVGSLIGRNEGNIEHCFNMCQILADASDNVGGLVGTNKGTMSYCYQAGYITSARNNTGGLVGHNDGGIVKTSYCSGYTLANGSNCGSVVGKNDGTFINTYFDQQMCLQKASTKDEAGVIGITTSKQMWDIFKDDDKWSCSEGFYPQLKCFEQTSFTASFVSSLPVWLPTSQAPIQRAEAVTENFVLCVDSGAKWSSPDNAVIKIQGSFASVYRPCSQRVMIITCRYEGSSRGVLLLVSGYKTFNAGIIGGITRVCNGDPVKFSDTKDGAEVINAVGGKDDDKENYPYYYRIERYKLNDLDNDGVYEDTSEVVSTIYLTSKDYNKYYCNTTEDGHWLYKRYVHDSQCQLDYLQSSGTFELVVFSTFDPGEIDDSRTVIYGNYPQRVHINNVEEALGGEGPYYYRWYISRLEVNYLTNDTTTIIDSVRIKAAKDSISFDTILSEPGEYVFYRSARDLYCSKNEFTPSRGACKFVIFDYLDPGEIEADTINLCSTEDGIKVAELSEPTGGNGVYSYRWMMNGQEIENTNKAQLNLTEIDLSPGNSYTFTRQVKDNTGLMDWTESKGKYVIQIYKTFNPGTIKTTSKLICLEDSVVKFNISGENQTLASGDGTIEYKWLVLDEDGKIVRTISTDAAELTDKEVKIDIALPANLTLVRQARTTLCSKAWHNSEGQVSISLDKNQVLAQEIVVCSEKLPFTDTYTFGNGETKSYTLTADEEVVRLKGKTQSGCSETIDLTCRVAEVPVVKVEPIGTICQRDTFIYINFEIISGNPDQYDISYNTAAYQAGFTDAHGKLTNTSQIALTVGAVPIGDFEMYISFSEGNSTSGCASIVNTIPFKVYLGGFIHQKWNDVLYIDNNDKNGFPDAENDLQFMGYQWYKDGEPIEGAIGQVYNEQGGLNGVYYAILTDVNGVQYITCPFEARPVGLQTIGNELGLYPTIATRGETININIPHDGRIDIINAAGQTIQCFNLTSGKQQFKAPQTTGVFLIRLTDKNHNTYFNKLIVK